jgi:L-asparagine oxygenase
MDGGQSMEKRSFISEGCLTGIARIIGKPFGYTSEKNGEVIHNICPIQNRKVLQSNKSSRVDLSLHVENAYFDTRPDYLALYCLRQDHKKEALTCVIDIRSAISKLDPTDVTELQRPVFVVPSTIASRSDGWGEMVLAAALV